MKMSTFSTSTHCRGGNVGLVLVVGGNQIDLPAFRRKPGILDRHLGRQRRARATEVGVETRHVGQHADLDGFVLRNSTGHRGQRQRGADEKR
jgi:hypothetical protein